ncbi:MAG TPA: ABC transporter permease [Symbiobacteriaceae bacterium]|jgi:putative hydroxymethylpyrimidine transport system permease protein
MRQYGAAGTLLLALLLIWEGLCRWLPVPTYILPAPSRALAALWQWRGPLFLEHLPVTALEILLGLGFSVLAGVAMAVAMHLSPLLNRALYPLIIASQTIPIVAISPVFLFWFGYTLTQKVAVVILITFFPVVVNTCDGLRSADPELLEWMRAAGASRRQMLRMVEVPAALPAFFTGLKVAAAVSVTGAVIAEWLGGQAGLSVYGRRAANNLKSPELFASVLLLSLLGIALFGLAAWCERRFASYTDRKTP